MDVWTQEDANSSTGADAAAQVREVAEGLGARVGGIPAQDQDFISAVYGNAWWILLTIIVVTFVLLAVFTVVEAGRAPAGTAAYRTDVDAGEGGEPWPPCR